MAIHDLPTVGQNPVVQQSHCRFGFRWRGQIADEDDLDNREHPDGPREGEADLRADRGSGGHDGGEDQ